MTKLVAGKVALGTGQQIFAIRNNEIFLMGQSRPRHGLQEGAGWNPESIIEHALPTLQSDFYPLDRSADVFSWDLV